MGSGSDLPVKGKPTAIRNSQLLRLLGRSSGLLLDATCLLVVSRGSQQPSIESCRTRHAPDYAMERGSPTEAGSGYENKAVRSRPYLHPRGGTNEANQPDKRAKRAGPSLISYPARLLQGGRLDRAPKKIGRWYAEPKYNGWRAVVRCPSGTMWNRRGKRSSIVGELDIALRVLLSRSRYALFNCASDERSQCRPA